MLAVGVLKQRKTDQLVHRSRKPQSAQHGPEEADDCKDELRARY